MKFKIRNISGVVLFETDLKGGNTDLGRETFLILDHMEAIAKLRKWPEQGEEHSAPTPTT